jgi:hypothetical protein
MTSKKSWSEDLLMLLAAKKLKIRNQGPKLVCNVCRRSCETLGQYGVAKWWVCLRCFEAADRIAAKEDRWPDERDFLNLKRAKLSNL